MCYHTRHEDCILEIKYDLQETLCHLGLQGIAIEVAVTSTSGHLHAASEQTQVSAEPAQQVTTGPVLQSSALSTQMAGSSFQEVKKTFFQISCCMKLSHVLLCGFIYSIVTVRPQRSLVHGPLATHPTILRAQSSNKP